MGEYPQMTLEDARKERTHAQELVRMVTNPAQERRDIKQETIEQKRAARVKKEHCFEAVALGWISQQKERWSKEHTDTPSLS